ncbi:MAG: lipopolysaccharide biosynthesis protein [Bacteroidales bacterium]
MPGFKNRIIGKLLPNKELLKNFLTLFTGATLGQLIPFLAGPILARLYSPEDFGLYALLSSTAGLASIIATGSYEFAILTSDDDDEANSLSLLSSLLSLIFSIFSAIIIIVVLLLVRPWSENVFGWIWLLAPVFIFLQGVVNSTNYRLNREKRYGVMARGRLARAFIMTGAQLLLGFMKLPWGLYPGMVTGHLTAAGYQFSKVKSSFTEAFKAFSFKKIKSIARKYYRFPSFLLPAQLVNEFSVQVPVYLLKSFFTTTAVGLYALPQKFLNVPVMLIGNSLGQVFFQKAVEQKDDKDALSATTLSLFRFLFRIGVVPFSIMLVFGDILFAFGFGVEWQQSGIFAQMLSPWLLFVLAGSPISKLFTVLDRQKQSLWLNIILLTLRTSGLIIGALLFRTENMAVLLFSLTGFFYWAFLTFFILRMAKVRLMPVIFETIVTWGLVVLPMLLVRWYFL